LNKAKIKKTYGIEIPHWEDSLAECIKEFEKLDK
jgi:dTDP-4-dehydrorhamnose reductase